MAAKKKPKDYSVHYEQDEALIALKERYFKLLKTEEYPKTPQITATLDKLEKAINKRKEEIVNELGNS